MIRVLAGYANGRELKEMAAEAYVSSSNMDNASYEAKQRLDARNLAQCIVKAIALGYLSHPTGPDLLVFPIFKR